MDMKTEQLQKEIYEAPAIEVIDIEVEQNIMGGSYRDLNKNVKVDGIEGFDGYGGSEDW